MKTRHTLLYILTALLSIFGVQTLYAQVTQDALYIFCNDGGFNAFFWGDINRIEYSKIDTLGVEQADYVVQEVYALDSVYRIPISAIDSVSFVTPETKYQADVIRPDKSIANYIVASDSVYWIRLALNTPAAMIPKVGDKYFIDDQSQFIPEGFGGLVQSVERGADGYTVTTTDIPLTDIYERLVVKTAAATPGNTSQEARRRGFFDGTEFEYGTVEPIDFPTVSVTLPLQGSLALLPDGTGVSLSGDLTGSYTTSMSPQMGLRFFLFYDLEYGLTYDQKLTFDTNYSTTVALSGSLTARMEIPFKGLGWEKEIGKYLILKAGTGIFMEAQCTAISLDYTWKSRKIHNCDITVKSDGPISSISLVDGSLIPSVWSNTNTVSESSEFTAATDGKWTFSTGLYAGLEVIYKYPGDKSWLANKFSKKQEDGTFEMKVEAKVEGGVKLEVDGVSWSSLVPADISPSLLQTYEDGIYERYNKDNNITLSGYGKFSLSGKFMKTPVSFSPEIDFGKTNLYGFVPDISGVNVDFDDEKPIRPYRIKAVSPIRRDLLLGVNVGFAVFDKKDKLVDYWCNHHVFREADEKPTYSRVFTKLDPAKDEPKTYTIYPMVDFMGHRILTDQKKEFTIDPARIDVEKEEIKTTWEFGMDEIEIQSNMENVGFESKNKWLDFSWLPTEQHLIITWEELPDGMSGRRGVILATGYDHDDNELVEKEITVIQGHPEIIDDIVDFGTTDYYSSKYEVSFQEKPKGHYMSIYLYNGDDRYTRVVCGYYTANKDKIGLTIEWITTEIDNEKTFISNFGVDEGDMLIIPYKKDEKGMVLDIGNTRFDLDPKLNIDGVWSTEDGIGIFELKDDYWSWKYKIDIVKEKLYKNWQFKFYFHIQQSEKKAVITMISTSRDDHSIKLPNEDFYIITENKYTCPLNYRINEKGEQLMTWELFGYTFELIKTGN